MPTDLTAATAEIGASMTECEGCPCCGGRQLEPVACGNDLDAIEGVADSMKDSDYHVCLDCSLIFARRRQSPDSIALFYQWFAHLERRDYAVYPPPENYIRAKAGVAEAYVRYLADQGVLSSGTSVAHVRCDVGSLLTQIKERFSDCTVHGHDYFESNIRYAHEQGLSGVSHLDPAKINLAPSTTYDLIVCNHILTHSFDPAGDLQILHNALKPGGVLFLYGEVDHFLRFQPKGPYYQWVALNNFHKQLFGPASLESFLNRGGFSVESRDHRGFYMQLLARREDSAGDTNHDAPGALAAKEAVPVMAQNFQSWAKLRDSRFLGLIKTTSKLKKALCRKG